jgi:hypothetical protein
MATFPFSLPTTGSLSFTDFLIDPSSSSSSSCTTHLAEANSARANLRAILKEERRTESSERDALGVVKVRPTDDGWGQRRRECRADVAFGCPFGL